jgi:hypothetical protein
VLGVFGKIKGMESTADAGFQIAKQDVDPAEFG